MTFEEQKYNQKHKAYHDEIRDQAAKFRQSISIDIDRQLRHDAETGNIEKAKKLLTAMSEGRPFMLFQDQFRNAIIIPKLKLIIRLYPGGTVKSEQLNDHQFQNQVKYLYVVYPHCDLAHPGIVKSALHIHFSRCSLSIPHK